MKYLLFELKEPHIYLIKNNPEFEQRKGITLKPTNAPIVQRKFLFLFILIHVVFLHSFS